MYAAPNVTRYIDLVNYRHRHLILANLIVHPFHAFHIKHLKHFLFKSLSSAARDKLHRV